MADNAFRVVFPIEAFDGGLNSKYEAAIVANNDSPSAQNVVFDDRGGVQTRLGSSKFNTALVGTNAAGSVTGGDGLFKVHFQSGTEVMTGWWNGSMFKQTGNTTFTTVPSAQSVFTAGTRVFQMVYQDLAFYGNGFKAYKYNENGDFTLMGINPPNSAPVITSGAGAASTVTGPDVQYRVSYVNSYSVEGDVGTVTSTLTLGTTASVSLASIPLAPQSFGVASRKLYRSDNGGTYKLVTTIADNTTTTYSDTKTAANLGADAPTDQGMPPEWSFGTVHQERVWINDTTEPQLLYYSETANPFVVKTTSFIRIGDGDGETIRGIHVHANNIVTYKDESVWVIYLPDDTPGNWLRLKTNSKYGGWSPHLFTDYSQMQMFIGKRNGLPVGFMALRGIDTQPNSTDLNSVGIHSDSQSDKIEPDVFTFNRSALSLAMGLEFKNKLWFTVPVSSSSVPNKVYVFDYQRRDESKSHGAWIPFDYPDDFTCFCVYGGVLYAQSATTGQVYKLEQAGYSDFGTAINSYIYTKEFYGYEEHQENWKDFRNINFIAETLGDYNMNVEYLTDGEDSGVTKLVSLNPGGSVWGSVNWNAFTWGAGATRSNFRIYTSPKSGKRIQIKFSNQNTVSQGFHVYPNASIIYNLRGKR